MAAIEAAKVAAGVIIAFMPIAGLAPARHGGACPLWISCRAGGSPGQTLRQRAVFPTGLGFVFVARSRWQSIQDARQRLVALAEGGDDEHEEREGRRFPDVSWHGELLHRPAEEQFATSEIGLDDPGPGRAVRHD